ncbi:hypothetical protein BGW80DRAFT_1253904 [Lactifluus volemus]|nr:hypothetical protein BGW80DRAFT_1253904 [Lactifluus volemus]
MWNLWAPQAAKYSQLSAQPRKWHEHQGKVRLSGDGRILIAYSENLKTKGVVSGVTVVKVIRAQGVHTTKGGNPQGSLFQSSTLSSAAEKILLKLQYEVCAWLGKFSKMLAVGPGQYQYAADYKFEITLIYCLRRVQRKRRAVRPVRRRKLGVNVVELRYWLCRVKTAAPAPSNWTLRHDILSSPFVCLMSRSIQELTRARARQGV